MCAHSERWMQRDQLRDDRSQKAREEKQCGLMNGDILQGIGVIMEAYLRDIHMVDFVG